MEANSASAFIWLPNPRFTQFMAIDELQSDIEWSQRRHRLDRRTKCIYSTLRRYIILVYSTQYYDLTFQSTNLTGPPVKGTSDILHPLNTSISIYGSDKCVCIHLTPYPALFRVYGNRRITIEHWMIATQTQIGPTNKVHLLNTSPIFDIGLYYTV